MGHLFNYLLVAAWRMVEMFYWNLVALARLVVTLPSGQLQVLHLRRVDLSHSALRLRKWRPGMLAFPPETSLGPPVGRLGR